MTKKAGSSEVATIGVVVIGRNEGERLGRCLQSASGAGRSLVYVDSGSTDGSVALARAKGAEVVALDMSMPFTAARARNAGLARLRALGPVEFLQFIDGDCELEPGWLDQATAYLEATPETGVVCGRRQEIAPETSVYNRLCDWEWATPVGRAKACGGDAMYRLKALEQAGLFNPALIAGEEPELCVRLRGKGWHVQRLDLPMTRHDANMTRFAQWWVRSRRGGHAFAEGWAMHGSAPERHFASELRRAVIWGGGVPLAILLLSLWNPGALWVFLVYPLQVLRLALREGAGCRAVWERALFLTLIKFPEFLGAVQYGWRRLTGGKAGLIEYK